MSTRLRDIIELTRRITSRDESGPYAPYSSLSVVEALVYLARIVDDYIDAQGDHVARERAYLALFEAVRAPVPLKADRRAPAADPTAATEERFSIEEVRAAFWKKFHECGEVWFNYLGDSEENEGATRAEWEAFAESLRQRPPEGSAP